jgi:anterior pharynx defective protein 1
MFFGCLTIAFSLPAALFYFVVAPSAKSVILMFGSAFVWLVAALATAIVWIAVEPLKEHNWFALIFAVGFQELFRFLYWKLLKRAEVGLNTLADDGSGEGSRDKQALVAGLGYSLMSTVMQFNSVLSESAGPGGLPALGCPEYSLYTISSIMAAAFGALNIMWSVILYSGLDDRHEGKNGWVKIAYVLITHYAVAFLTLNNDAGGACGATLIPLYIMVFVTAGYTWKIARLTYKKAA